MTTKAPQPRPYRIRIAGQKTRTAASLHGAKVALGQMMCSVPVGTIGRINFVATPTIELGIIVGRCESLGWTDLTRSARELEAAR